MKNCLVLVMGLFISGVSLAESEIGQILADAGVSEYVCLIEGVAGNIGPISSNVSVYAVNEASALANCLNKVNAISYNDQLNGLEMTTDSGFRGTRLRVEKVSIISRSRR